MITPVAQQPVIRYRQAILQYAEPVTVRAMLIPIKKLFPLPIRKPALGVRHPADIPLASTDIAQIPTLPDIYSRRISLNVTALLFHPCFC